jgi:hypothetical protein
MCVRGIRVARQNVNASQTNDQTYAPPAILRTVCVCTVGADRCIPCRRALEVRENIMVNNLPIATTTAMCALLRVAPCCCVATQQGDYSNYYTTPIAAT